MKDELLQLNVLLQLKSELHFYFHKLFQGLAINLKLLCCIYAYLIPSGIGLVLIRAAVAAYYGLAGLNSKHLFFTVLEAGRSKAWYLLRALLWVADHRLLVSLPGREMARGVLWGLSYKGMNPINFQVHVISNSKLYSRLNYLSSSGRGKLRKVRRRQKRIPRILVKGSLRAAVRCWLKEQPVMNEFCL